MNTQATKVNHQTGEVLEGLLPETPTWKSLPPHETSEKSTGAVAKKIAAVMADVEKLVRDGVNKQQHYRYATEAAVMAATHGPMAKHNLAIFPSIVDFTTILLGYTEKGNPYFLTTVIMRFRIEDGDTGEYTVVTMVGQGTDTGDKGMNKAVTTATKYLYIKLYALASEDDPEASNDPESVSSEKKPYRKMPSNYPGACVVCGKPYKKGDSIYWHFEKKEGTHEACWGKEPAPPLDPRSLEALMLLKKDELVEKYNKGAAVVFGATEDPVEGEKSFGESNLNTPVLEDKANTKEVIAKAIVILYQMADELKKAESAG